MAIDLPSKPQTSRERSSKFLDLRPRTVVLCVLLPVALTAGVLGGLKLDALHAQQELRLDQLQEEKSALISQQKGFLKGTQDADRLRLREEAKLEILEEQLKNQDGFLR